MNKGFDLSDEGFSLLSLTEGQEQGMEIMPVYIILQKFFSVFNPGVVFYRLLRLVLLLAGTAVFVTGLISCLRKILPEVEWPVFGITYPVAILCGLINYSRFYQTLSYNSLTFIMILIAAGILLKGLCLSESDSQKRKNLFLPATGLSCGILFLIKLSSGILFSAVSLLLLFTNIPKKEKMKSLAITVILFFSGFSVALLLLYVAGSSPVAFAANFIKASSLLPGHQFSVLLEVYREDLQKNFFEVILYHKLFLLIPVILWLLYRFAYTRMFVSAFIFSCLLLMQKFVNEGWYKSGMEGLYSASLVYILLMWFFFVFLLMESLAFLLKLKYRPTSLYLQRLWPVYLFLTFIPFVASAGTNNPLSVHVTQFLFFWMINFLIFIQVISNLNKLTGIIRPMFALILLFMVSSQFLYGYIQSPYRLNDGLIHQTFKFSAGKRVASLFLDQSACNFVNAIMSILKEHGYDKGDYHAISLYSYPGLVYLSGATSPGAAWYFGDGYDGNDKANCFMISKTKIPDLKRTVIFLDGNSRISTEFSACLKTKGILFPENYFCADSVMLPDSSGYMKIYLPN